MKTRIKELEDHFIVCGGGFTGTAIIEELAKTRRQYVIVEKDPERCEVWQKEDKLVLEGDALRDETLEEAGIGKARGIFCAVDSDVGFLRSAASTALSGIEGWKHLEEAEEVEL